MTDTRTVQKSDEDKDTQKEYVDLMHSSSSQDGENECALIDGKETSLLLCLAWLGVTLYIS